MMIAIIGYISIVLLDCDFGGAGCRSCQFSYLNH